jgi:ferredoxin, 2Fe-2S
MPQVTFIQADGTARTVETETGLTLLQVARDHSVAIEGACEGSLACATCHVILDEAWADKVPQASIDEEDMLDMATGLQPTSRLGCQIVMTDALDGLIVKVAG